MGTITDEVALPCNKENPSAISAPAFPPTRTLDPSGRRIVTSREEEEVLESRDKVEKSGPGDSAPIASNASANEPRLAITRAMNLVFAKSGFNWQASAP